jgi:hypothetical protein
MPTFDFEMEHFRVLGRAQQIFKDKSKLRGQMWLEFPPSDKIRELIERARRLESGYQHIRFEDGLGPDTDAVIRLAMIEDALDIINYATFFVKQLERGQRG